MRNPRLIYDIEPDAYRAASSAEYECEWSFGTWFYQSRICDAKHAIGCEIERLQKFAPNHEILLALGDSTNFRYGVYRDYKSNRRKFRKPAGYSVLLQWIRDTWTCLSLPNVEADDVVGIAYQQDDIIYSRDKDLKTIPGLHLDGEGNLLTINKWEADLNFYRQIIQGDSCDGYPGIKGLGSKGAMKILKKATNEFELWQCVNAAYEKALKKDPETPTVISQARCARILRSGEYDFENEQPIYWKPPVEPVETLEGTFIPTFHD